MEARLEWDEAKRRNNLRKHGLDFVNAHWVLESHYRFDIHVMRNGEHRIQSVSYVMGMLAVLSVVHVDRSDAIRIISFRRASKEEREAYHAWLEEKIDDDA